MNVSFIRTACVRTYLYGEHGCAVAFAGLEFTSKAQLLLTVSSVVLLAALILLALFFAKDAKDKVEARKVRQ